MRKYLLAAVLVLMASGAQATLIDRGDGFIYDTVQDITWTQNANISGKDSWSGQMAWAAGYSQTHTVYGTFADWRLPTTLQPDASCAIQDDPGGPEPPTQSIGVGCTGSEMGHLFNVDGIAQTSMGPFLNVQDTWYWSGTYAGEGSGAYAGTDWSFVMLLYPDHVFPPEQQVLDQDSYLYAWGVRDGDVVPEPSTGLLVALGLTALSWKGRRRRGAGDRLSGVGMRFVVCQ